MNKYTAVELAEILGISETAVRKKLRRGDFETVEETVNNRSVTKILLTDSRLNELIENSRKNKQVYQTFPNHTPDVFSPEEPVQDNALEKNEIIGFMERYAERLENYTEQIVSLTRAATESGTKLMFLEDKSTSLHEDLKFYKDEYFKLKYENEQLTKVNGNVQKTLSDKDAEITFLKDENNQLKQDIAAEKKRPFWKKNVL